MPYSMDELMQMLNQGGTTSQPDQPQRQPIGRTAEAMRPNGFHALPQPQSLTHLQKWLMLLQGQRPGMTERQGMLGSY